MIALDRRLTRGHVSRVLRLVIVARKEGDQVTDTLDTTRLEELIPEARAAVEARGHSLSEYAFTRGSRDPERTAAGSLAKGMGATCQKCDMDVSIFPNYSYEIMGEAVAVDCPGIQPWSDDKAREYAGMASRCLFQHDHNASDRDPLTRENCGACVLGGYRPRGGWGDEELDAKGAGPNYSGWARVYVEARASIPRKWRDAFQRERDSENRGYAIALERSIATFGVRFR